MNAVESQLALSTPEDESLPHVAYGPVRSPEVMERIVGGTVKMLGHVGVENIVLVEQVLSDVSDSGNPSPQEVLSGIVDSKKFKSMGATINTEDPNRGIGGTLFMLTPEQKAKLDEYELVPEGWFKRARVDVVHPDGIRQEAETHVLTGDFQSSRSVADEEQTPLIGEDRADLLKSIDLYNASAKENK